MNITSDWNYRLDRITNNILQMQAIAMSCPDIKQSAALLKTIERLLKRVEDSRLTGTPSDLGGESFADLVENLTK